MTKKRLTYLGIIIAGLIFCLATLLSGIKYLFGYGFYNAHGHDAIWHLAVANQTLKSIPPPNPVLSGYKLNGYHWGYDIILQLIHKLTTIPTITLYFQILPLIITALIALYSYKLKQNHTSALFFIFLNFFAGSFGYLVTLIKHGQIGGESLFWSMQSVSTLINPPYALSLVILLSALYYWRQNQSKLSNKKAILLGIFLGLNTIIKIYAAIIVGLSFSLLYIYQKITKHPQHRQTFYICLSMATISLILLFIIGPSGSTLVFRPFWFVHSLIDSTDKLYLPTISSLRYNLSNQFLSYKLPVLFFIEVLSFLVFLIGNLGTRILSLFDIKRIIKTNKSDQINPLFLFVSLISIIIPSLFIQQGTAWNTIQFFYYFLIIANFYFADFLTRLYNQKRFFILTIILILTIPTTLSTLRSFVGFPPPASLPKSEIKALDFLKTQPDGIVLTYPYDHYQSQTNTPIPLSKYQTSAYVSAFSGHITFLEDEMNLDITGYDWQSRLKLVNSFFNDNQPIKSVGILLNNNIDYIYLNQNNQQINSNIKHQLKQIYNQDNIRIYQVLK